MPAKMVINILYLLLIKTYICTITSSSKIISSSNKRIHGSIETCKWYFCFPSIDHEFGIRFHNCVLQGILTEKKEPGRNLVALVLRKTLMTISNNAILQNKVTLIRSAAQNWPSFSHFSQVQQYWKGGQPGNKQKKAPGISALACIRIQLKSAISPCPHNERL